MARADGADGISRGARGARSAFLGIERFSGIGVTLRADEVLEEVVIMGVTPGTLAGTNTVVDRYRMKLTGPNQFISAPLNSPGQAKVKAGEIAVRWSYGSKNKGYILINLSILKASLHDLSEFEKGL